MCIKLTSLISFVAALTVAQSASAGPVGHWRFDEGAGTTAYDTSGNGNDGTLQGNPKWGVGRIGGALELDGTGDYVDCGNRSVLNVTQQVTLTAWVKPDPGFAYPDWSGIIMRGGPNIDTFALYYNGPSRQIGFKTTGTSPNWMAVAAAGLFDSEWHHVAAVYDGARKIVHLDGEPIGTTGSTGLIETSTGRLLLGAGRDLSTPTHLLVGKIDDARIYDVALTQIEIQAVMEGGEGYPYALPLNPSDGALHADTWVSLSWKAGDFAVSHDVYLGDSFDDVSNGTGDTFRGNQTTTSLLIGFPGYLYPDGLVPGTTYYWRIDEVNTAEPNSPWKGFVWSFSIPPRTAYNPNPGDGAESVALNARFTWTAGYGAKLHTLYFGENFDNVSSAVNGGTMVGTTAYSPPSLKSGKVYYWRVDEFDGVATYKGQVWSFATLGAVGSPYPSNGASSAEMNAILSWTPSDNAASHQVYFGTDKEALRKADTGSPEYKGVKALGAESYDPGLLAWNSTYYWRVDEVNTVNANSPWKGPLWSFTTGNFLLVDGFESYNDIDPPDPKSNRIFDKWIDGFATPTTNGALVGNALPPYAERTVIHGGKQSMPYAYDTNLKSSEATLTLAPGRDWTAQGVTTLSLWFQGTPTNAAEKMYVVLNGTAVVYNNDTSLTQKTGWTEWVIPLQQFAAPGVNLTNVTSITIGFGTRGNTTVAGGTGKVIFDDMRLYRPATP